MSLAKFFLLLAGGSSGISSGEITPPSDVKFLLLGDKVVMLGDKKVQIGD